MKELLKVSMFLVVILIAGSITWVEAYGQSPQYISYQAVVNDAEGNPVEGSIGLRISILNGPDSSTVVYSERHSVNSDKNGLVSIRIGEGDNVYKGEFAIIDWSDGPYFVRVEIAPTGGYVYSISTTNELLSVPFALYALRADSVSQEYKETDPLFSASASSGITEEDTSRWNSLTKTAKYSVGEKYGGGIIFYIEPSGEHGLIASMQDIKDTTVWGNPGVLTGAKSSYDGSVNTASIVSSGGPGDYAAYYCDTLSAGGDDDWYLPSVDELFLLFKARYIVNSILEADADENTTALIKDVYWTSTEKDQDKAMVFRIGNPAEATKDEKGSVRSVRAF